MNIGGRKPHRRREEPKLNQNWTQTEPVEYDIFQLHLRRFPFRAQGHIETNNGTPINQYVNEFDMFSFSWHTNLWKYFIWSIQKSRGEMHLKMCNIHGNFSKNMHFWCFPGKRCSHLVSENQGKSVISKIFWKVMFTSGVLKSPVCTVLSNFVFIYDPTDYSRTTPRSPRYFGYTRRVFW